MRYKRAVIDSLSLSDFDIENCFVDKEHYIIELIKSIGVHEPKEWFRTFGKSLNRSTIEAKIIHTHTGLTIPLKRHARSPQNQTIEFAGLHGYNDRSKLLKQVLRDKESQLSDHWLHRIDIAIDYYGDLPDHIKRALKKLDRRLFKYGNTSYYKTAKEKKVNQYMNIKVYDKQHQAKLNFACMRLEFSFRSSYFGGVLLKDIDKTIKKMEKSIKKSIGLSVKIKDLF